MILKYKLQADTVLTLTEGFKVLTCKSQDGHPVVWVDCDLTAAPVDASFVLVVTGAEAPKGGTYISTVFLEPLVLHVYLEAAQ